jgi:3-methyladenine DNA glycosylase AlkC
MVRCIFILVQTEHSGKVNGSLFLQKKGQWELYNLDKDRTELNDLSKRYPEKVEEIANEWFDIAKNKDRLSEKIIITRQIRKKSIFI